jgi:hypothetical protein
MMRVRGNRTGTLQYKPRDLVQTASLERGASSNEALCLPIRAGANLDSARAVPTAQHADVERDILTIQHTLHSTGLFDDAALAALIDAHPPDDIHVHHMSGTNESPVYLDAETRGLSGDEVLRAVATGRVWLSLVHVEQHPEYSALIHSLYAGLEDLLPLRTIRRTQLANLLISSPTAEVFYHADAHPTVLWHIRGEKDLYIYPPWQERFLSRENRELCLLGMLMDDVYRADYDSGATVLRLRPGDAATWPQSTPHRVVNVAGLNVSLSSEHHTRASLRRRRIASANWLLRKRLGVEARSLETQGFVALAKTGISLSAKVLGRVLARGALVPEDPEIAPTIRLDPDDPRGYVEISPAAG